jgi:hypothetical protein
VFECADVWDGVDVLVEVDIEALFELGNDVVVLKVVCVQGQFAYWEGGCLLVVGIDNFAEPLVVGDAESRKGEFGKVFWGLILDRNLKPHLNQC